MKIAHKFSCFFVIFLSVVASTQIWAETNDLIDIEITSTSNLRQSGAIEVCGKASHKDGIKPLLVTIRHDESYYTTLTAPNGAWCQVIKRWTFDGRVSVSASTLADVR